MNEVVDKTSKEFENLLHNIKKYLNILEKKIIDLSEKIFYNISILIEQIKNSILEIEKNIMNSIDKVLDKIFNYYDGTMEDIRSFLGRVFHLFPNPTDYCRRVTNTTFISGPQMTTIQFFNLFECHQLQRLRNKKVKVKEIKEVYATLERTSFRLHCAGRNTMGFRDIFLKKWLNYGSLYSMWNEFSDTMTPEEAYNQAIQKLQAARQEYLDKSSEFDKYMRRQSEITIGSVVAFSLDIPGINNLAPEWHIADGTVLSDNSSPLNGKKLPNLKDRFILGASSKEDELKSGPNDTDYSSELSTEKQTINSVSSFGGVLPNDSLSGDTRTDERATNHIHKIKVTSDDLPKPPYYKLIYMVKVR